MCSEVIQILLFQMMKMIVVEKLTLRANFQQVQAFNVPAGKDCIPDTSMLSVTHVVANSQS